MLSRAKEQLDAARPFVLYRKPDTAALFGIFQADDSVHSGSDLSQSGFIFAPFDGSKLPVLLRPDQIFYSDAPAVSERLKAVKVSGQKTFTEGKKMRHINLVAVALKAIHQGVLRKVVLSCSIEVPSKQHPLAKFPALLDMYPEAFCYLWYHPHIGTWMGATPELLLEKQGDKLMTMALAGTQPFRTGSLPEWTDKEKEEQNMVTSYLKDRLHSVSEELKVDETVSVRAAGVWHLRNILRAKAGLYQLQTIVSALHPTPAVCGLPVGVATDFIKNNESYDRQFYTGYLGELNLGDQSGCSLFVNLRCMQYDNHRYLLYAGGGITAGSSPENEWLEIMEKWNTMMLVLHNSE